MYSHTVNILKGLSRAVILSVIVMMTATAQTEPFKPRTYVGLKSGFNVSTAQFGHALERLNILEGYQSGFHVGLMAINYLEKNVGLQVELNYTQKGWTQLFGAGTQKFITDMDYIELPFMMNVYIGRKKTRLYFNFGWYFEYLLRVKASDLPTDTGVYDFHPYDTSRDRKFGYGLVGGGGIYRDFSFGTLILQGSFAFGISNILDPITETSGIPDISNLITSTFSIGYLINLNK